MFTCYQDDIRRALIQIQENGMDIRNASRKFVVPKPLYKIDQRKKVPDIHMKTGPPPRSTVTGENEIVQWLINKKCRLLIRKSNLISIVQKILKDCGKHTI